MDLYIGIDLGMVTTEVACVECNKTQVIHTAPSVVYFDENTIEIGESAVKNHKTEETAFFYKRNIGFNLPYFFMKNGKSYTAADILSVYLKSTVKQIEEKKGMKVKGAVISVPIYFNDNEINNIKEAAKKAGIKLLGIINEPVAAVIAYNFINRERKKIMVYDLGGGTFDVSIVEAGGNKAEIIAFDNDFQLNGEKWDREICFWAAEQYNKSENYKDFFENPEHNKQMMKVAEKIKHQFTEDKAPKISIGYDEKTYILTESEFRKRTRHLLVRTGVKIQNLFAEKNISWNDIDEVILSGALTKMKMVSDYIIELRGKPALNVINADDVVCRGAAYMAYLMGQKNKNKTLENISSCEEVTLKDFLLSIKSVEETGLADIPENITMAEIILSDTQEDKIPEGTVIKKVPKNISQEETVIKEVSKNISQEETVIKEIPKNISQEETAIKEVSKNISQEETVIKEILKNISQEGTAIKEVPKNISQEETVIKEIPKNTTSDLTSKAGSLELVQPAKLIWPVCKNVQKNICSDRINIILYVDNINEDMNYILCIKKGTSIISVEDGSQYDASLQLSEGKIIFSIPDFDYGLDYIFCVYALTQNDECEKILADTKYKPSITEFIPVVYKPGNSTLNMLGFPLEFKNCRWPVGFKSSEIVFACRTDHYPENLMDRDESFIIPSLGKEGYKDGVFKLRFTEKRPDFQKLYICGWQKYESALLNQVIKSVLYRICFSLVGKDIVINNFIDDFNFLPPLRFFIFDKNHSMIFNDENFKFDSHGRYTINWKLLSIKFKAKYYLIEAKNKDDRLIYEFYFTDNR